MLYSILLSSSSKSSSDEFANVGKPNNVHVDKELWGTTPHSQPFLLGVGPLAFDLPRPSLQGNSGADGCSTLPKGDAELCWAGALNSLRESTENSTNPHYH